MRATRSNVLLVAVSRWALISVCLAGCATNPLTGRREMSVLTPAQEASQGRRMAAALEQQTGTIEDAGLRAYVIGVGKRVAAQSPRKDVRYQFNILNTQTPNALALPGGYIYITSGLMSLLNSEEELAGILAHEVVHVAARHSSQRKVSQAGIDLLAKLGAIGGTAIGTGTGIAVGSVGRQIAGGLLASYNRDQEREADRVGQQLAAAAGYDPTGLTRALEALGADAASAGVETDGGGFFDSHPGTTERVMSTRRQAPTLSVGPSRGTRRSREAFLAEIDGLLMDRDPASGVLARRGLYVNPSLGLAMEFPRGWPGRVLGDRAIALAPKADGLVQLETQATAGPPAEAARIYLRTQRVSVEEREELSLDGMQAYRVRGQVRDRDGDVYHAEWLWVAHARGTVRLTATTPTRRAKRYAGVMQRALLSVRRASAADVGMIRVPRIAVVAAREGETLEQLGRRVQNRWSVDKTALANAIDASAPLAAGFPVKVLIRDRYAPAR